MRTAKKTVTFAIAILLALCIALAGPFATRAGDGAVLFETGNTVVDTPPQTEATPDYDTPSSGSVLGGTAAAKGAAKEDAPGAAVDIPDGYVLDYSAHSFEKVPDDFELYDKSETDRTTATFADGDMIIDNKSGRASNGTLYYGSLYRFATNKAYSDFLINLKFKVDDFSDDGRFFSLMFHTATNTDDMLIGYFVNYRVNGGSAVSCYDGAAAHDTNSVNRGIRLNDDKYHTMTLVLKGTNLKSYMDGTPLHDVSISNKDDFLGGAIENGGFALMVNRMIMSVHSIDIYRSPDYSVSNFSSLPADWAPFDKSNVDDSTTRYENGEMIITDDGGEAGNYYGAVYRIATGHTFTNFDFSMTFRMLDYADAGRFISVMFHNDIQPTGHMRSYFVNYRMDGRSAPSAYAGSDASDGAAENVGVRLDDGQKHTVRITLVDTEVTDYIDGVKITSWDLSERAAKIPEIIEEGGFSVMVNNSTMAISSVSITSVPRDDNFINANYDMASGLINGAIVVADAVNESVLNKALSAAVRPSDVILRYGDDGEVRGTDNASIGDFYSVYKRIRGKIIPVVRIESTAAADKFIDFMKNKFRIADISVASSTPAIVKRIRDSLPWVRGMIYYDSVTSPSALISELNVNKATVAILPQSAATLDVVTYIQARFKTVWAVPDSYRFLDIYDCVNSGAYGIVSEHFGDVYEALATYKDRSVSRASMNVAHRGCSNLSYENSLSAVRLAIENGATHLELDGKLTTDGHIIIIHDDQVKNTTNYDGNKTAEQMSLAELQSYDLQLRGTPKRYLQDEHGNNIIEHLPSLDEVLELIKDTDVILVFEIKTDTTGIVPVLKEVAEEYDMLDRLIVISFSDADMLDVMYETMPGTPTAKLEGLGNNVWSMANIGEVIEYINTKNSALDKAYYTGGADAQFNRYLRDRGMVGWYWTFADEAAVDVGEDLGYVGITNNCAEVYADRARFVRGAEQSTVTLKAGDKVKVNVTDYSGNTVITDGEVFYLKPTPSGWSVIARYSTPHGYMYTQSFAVEKR